MEELDESLAREIHSKIKNKDRCQIISSGEFNASQMTSILGKLDLLITSRYHASVLSLKAEVPQIAVGHDLRLSTIYQDLGLHDDYFISQNAPHLWEDVEEKVSLLLRDPHLQQDKLQQRYLEQLSLSQQNSILLGEFLKQKKLLVRE